MVVFDIRKHLKIWKNFRENHKFNSKDFDNNWIDNALKPFNGFDVIGYNLGFHAEEDMLIFILKFS